MQLVNIVISGTLRRDVPTYLPNTVGHCDPTRHDRLHHELAMEPGDMLASLNGGGARPCGSGI